MCFTVDDSFRLPDVVAPQLTEYGCQTLYFCSSELFRGKNHQVPESRVVLLGPSKKTIT